MPYNSTKNYFKIKCLTPKIITQGKKTFNHQNQVAPQHIANDRQKLILSNRQDAVYPLKLR